MTLILQESEQISLDLLRPLLDSVGNENQVTCFALYLFLVFFSFSFFYLFSNWFHVLFFCITLSIWFYLFSQTISPMSWTLGEKVIRNCTAKLKPYLMKAVESSGRALNEYAQIVTDICQNESESPQRDDANGSKKTVVCFICTTLSDKLL